MSISNKPRDHHFIPVFYLKQWCGPDKKLIEYTVKHGNFIAKPVGPKGTGFQTDLYAFPELPPDIAQHMEDVFLKSLGCPRIGALDSRRRHLLAPGQAAATCCGRCRSVPLEDLPDWNWRDISAHFRCTKCGTVGCVDTRNNWSEVIDFNKGVC